MDPTEEIFEALHALMHQYRSQQFQALRDTPDGITHMEAKALGFFTRLPGSTQSDLIAHSGRDKGQIGRLIASLRDKGLLEATPDENDKRTVRLRATAAGLAVQKAANQQGRRLARQAMAGVTDAERATLLAVLRKLRDNLPARD